ncbi:hypothetical protein M947_03265 [Sulfurimonas hongkongensis]|uniref:Uncharacterized protein n=1 Tax=Sulfurimonas hongkongensis TaxID=1172190 RepID=T0KST6_9BACT|nr:hypothetical protein [Sulfurimonas hongkongensis]EQB40054.1 hypothetical protein M947_03265 [Sulfurimonas hongkongensis]
MSIASVTSSSLYSASIVKKRSETSEISTDAISLSAVSSDSATISTKWGFKVDENGFFSTDFNKAAGIPDNIKIHKQQMDTVEQYAKIVGSNDDPVKALGKVWDFFAKVAGNTLDSDGSMSIEQVSKMPRSFEFTGSLFDNPISIQQTQKEYLQVSKISGDIQGMSENTFETGFRSFFGENIAVGDNLQNIKSIYQNYISPNYNSSESKDQISVGELFGAFCTQTIGGTDQATYNATKAYYKFLETGQDFESYLTDKFGADYVTNLADGMNIHFDDPDMFDTLMKEIDRHTKENYSSYLSGQSIAKDSILSKNDNNTPSSAYQTLKNAKLPTSGKLLNLGV